MNKRAAKREICLSTARNLLNRLALDPPRTPDEVRIQEAGLELAEELLRRGGKPMIQHVDERQQAFDFGP